MESQYWWVDCRESSCQRAGKPGLVAHSKPWPRSLCGYHSDESWSRLSHVELMDRLGWERGAADPTPKNTAHHICADVTHIHRHTHRHKTPGKKRVGIRGEPVIREHFSSLISIACLMRKNTSGFCGQEPSLIILKRNATPPQLELRTLFSAAVYVEQSWEKKFVRRKGGGKQFMLFSNQSNQRWSASVSRSLMYQMNTRHLHVVVWLFCAHSHAIVLKKGLSITVLSVTAALP